MADRLRNEIARRAAQWSVAVRGFLPGPVAEVFRTVAETVSKRRRSVIVIIVLAQHAAVLLLLAAMPPKAVPVSTIAMDVTLFRLPGPPSPITDVPAPDRGGETDGEAPEASPSEPSPEPADPVAAESASDANEPPTPALAAAADDASETSEQPSLDVLAMVEQITGSDVETIAQAVPSATPVTSEQLRALLVASRPAGGGCSIEALVQESLQGDAGVRASLASVPRDQLSISYAIQLWDGAWVPLAADGLDVSGSIRTVIAEAVDAAPPRCRNQINEGPRFFIVETSNNTVTIVAFGSGSWRWRDLLPPRRPAFFGWFMSLNR